MSVPSRIVWSLLWRTTWSLSCNYRHGCWNPFCVRCSYVLLLGILLSGVWHWISRRLMRGSCWRVFWDLLNLKTAQLGDTHGNWNWGETYACTCILNKKSILTCKAVVLLKKLVERGIFKNRETCYRELELYWICQWAPRGFLSWWYL